jgi:hypothetical protein
MGQTLGDHPCDRDRVRRERGQHFRPSRCKRLTTRVCTTPNDEAQCVAEAANLLETIGISVGWSAPNPEDGILSWPLKVLGLLISVGAATLGAPIWYRVLDKIGTLRNTGQPPPPDS